MHNTDADVFLIQSKMPRRLAGSPGTHKGKKVHFPDVV
jgi:hypothetical protein